MEYFVTIKGLDQLTAKLAQAPTIASPILAKAMGASQAILAKYTRKGVVPWKTGFLTQSFIAELTPGILRWFPTASYAPFVELGTAPHVITPKDKMALFWPGANHPVKSVNHPGTQPNQYMERIVESSLSEINAVFGIALVQITEAIALQ
jgi:hypothetical protein